MTIRHFKMSNVAKTEGKAEGDTAGTMKGPHQVEDQDIAKGCRVGDGEGCSPLL